MKNLKVVPHTISIAKDFSRFPAGRFSTDGPFSGEQFRDATLLPLLQKGEPFAIKLDGTLGYGSSFLEEAFGGLVRVHRLQPADLKAKMSLSSSDRSLTDEIWCYVMGTGT